MAAEAAARLDAALAGVSTPAWRRAACTKPSMRWRRAMRWKASQSTPEAAAPATAPSRAGEGGQRQQAAARWNSGERASGIAAFHCDTKDRPQEPRRRKTAIQL